MAIKSLLPALASLALAAPVTAASAASLVVTVQGLRNDKGHVRIGVCPKPLFLSERCPYHAIVSAQAGSVTTRIDGIPPGDYAVAAYQDETDSARLKRNLFGVPQEGTGFSRNPSMRFGPPSFSQAAISIGEAGGAITIALRYF